MTHRKLALRYARALLDALPESGDRHRADDFLAALGRTLSQQADLREMLADPAIPRSERKRILRTVAEAEDVPERLKNFLDVVVNNGRITALTEIAEAFHAALEAAEGIVPAELTTATPLSEDLKKRVRSTLETITGKQVRLDCRVRPALIGGVVTRIGSMVYDGSLRTQLDRLRQRMAEE